MLLALDTATKVASVAVVATEGHVLAEASAVVTTHSELLLTLVDRVLEQAGCSLQQVEALVCGTGPGSFTGLRIGLATAKGLCFAADRPLCGVCSLDALGSGAAEEGTVAALLDARRSQLYWRQYSGDRPLGPPEVGTLEELADALAGTAPLLVGEGALAYRAELKGLIPAARWPQEQAHRLSAARLAVSALPAVRAGDFGDLDQVAPIYLRGPDIRPTAASEPPRVDP